MWTIVGNEDEDNDDGRSCNDDEVSLIIVSGEERNVSRGNTMQGVNNEERNEVDVKSEEVLLWQQCA